MRPCRAERTCPHGSRSQRNHPIDLQLLISFLPSDLLVRVLSRPDADSKRVTAATCCHEAHAGGRNPSRSPESGDCRISCAQPPVEGSGSRDVTCADSTMSPTDTPYVDDVEREAPGRNRHQWTAIYRTAAEAFPTNARTAGTTSTRSAMMVDRGPDSGGQSSAASSSSSVSPASRQSIPPREAGVIPREASRASSDVHFSPSLLICTIPFHAKL